MKGCLSGKSWTSGDGKLSRWHQNPGFYHTKKVSIHVTRNQCLRRNNPPCQYPIPTPYCLTVVFSLPIPTLPFVFLSRFVVFAHRRHLLSHDEMDVLSQPQSQNLETGGLKASDVERQALLDFYYSTNREGWTNSTGWLIGDPCVNEWYGVTHVRRVRRCDNGSIGAK